MVQNSQETDMCPLCSKRASSQPGPHLSAVIQDADLCSQTDRVTQGVVTGNSMFSNSLFSGRVCSKSHRGQTSTQHSHVLVLRRLSLPETKGNHWSQVSHTAPHSRGFSGVFERLRLPGPWLVLSLFPFMCGSCWLHLKATYNLCQLC